MRRQGKWLRHLGIMTILLLIYLLVPAVHSEVNRATAILAAGELEPVHDYLLSFGWWGPVVSVLLMVLQALFLPLPAFVITFTNAWLYGWVWGAILSWSGAMLAAVICYGLAGWFGRPLVVRLVGESNLNVADGFFQRYGGWAILITRLIPVVSFDLISYASGLTSVNLWTFVWATGLGQLPATLVYSYLGQSLAAGAQTFLWGLALAFIFVSLGWALTRWFKGRNLPRRDSGEK